MMVKSTEAFSALSQEMLKPTMVYPVSVEYWCGGKAPYLRELRSIKDNRSFVFTSRLYRSIFFGFFDFNFNRHSHPASPCASFTSLTVASVAFGLAFAITSSCAKPYPYSHRAFSVAVLIVW